MLKGQKSSLNGIELFLCPFTDLFITQGSNESFSHKGIMAWDVRGVEAGVRYPYYAPATSKCIRTYPKSGQVMWQTVNNVRCSNGYVGKVTYMTVHDDSMDVKIGQVINQGSQLGNMGKKGNATGVHCHIEFSQSADTSWFKNQYGNYMFNNEVDPEDVCFMDNTNILSGTGNWKYTNSLYIGNPVERSLGKDQIEVFTDKFYPTGRKEPMGYISGFIKSGIYNILETKEQNNLTWYKVGDDLWFDFGEDWAKVLPKGDVTKDQVIIKELENQVVELKEQIDKLKDDNKLFRKENEELLNKNVTYKKEIDRLKEQLANQPTLIFTCKKHGDYRIELYENEQLFIK